MRFSSVAALAFAGVVTLSGCSAFNTAQEDTTAVADRAVRGTPQVVTPEPPEFPDGTVASVVDIKNGNTLILRIEGDDREVRLINVLAPNDRTPEISGDCLMDGATDFMKNLLPAGTKVTLNFDPTVGTSGYLEAAVYKGKEFVNRSLVAEGFGAATYLSFTDKFYQEISDAQLSAAEKKKGVYSPNTECSIPRALADAHKAVEGAGSLGEEEALQTYRDSSDLYNELQRNAGNPASWAGSIATLAPIRAQMQELRAVLGDNYFDQNGVKAADKKSANPIPVRPGQESSAAVNLPADEAEPTAEPTAERSFSEEDVADVGAVEVEPEG